MREIVGDTVLTAPMLQWGPMFSLFVEELLAGTWTAEQQPWLGLDAQAVDLAPYFSPKVAPATVELVLAKKQELAAATGAAAFHHIFCGPLKKQWVYAHAAGSSGARAEGCGFQPVWQRLETPTQVNLNHCDPLPVKPGPCYHAHGLLIPACDPAVARGRS